jgi:GABA permease
MAGRRILVVANETVAGRELLDELKKRTAGGDAEVLVVAPALNTRLRYLFADVDHARELAEQRLAGSIETLRANGIEARGAVGDSNPLVAIEDALFEFDADEIIISTHPPERSNWLEKKTVDRARERFDRPITHVVVDLQRDWATAE